MTGSASLDPFGGPAAVTGTGYAGNPLRFHGQYLDTVTGLYDLRARDYDASAGRFTGPDAHPAQSGVGFTQAYGYAGNRPTVDADPSGLCPLCIGAGLGALIGGGTYLVHVARSDDAFSWSGLGRSAGTGVLYGGLIGAGGEAGFALADGFAGVVAAGAGAGLGSVTAGGLSSQLFDGAGYSWSDAGGGLVSAGAGSLAGRAGRTVAGRAVVSRVQVAAAWLARNAPGPRPKDLTAITCAGAGQAETEAATLTTAAETAGVAAQVARPRNARGQFTSGAGGDSAEAAAGRSAHLNYENTLGGGDYVFNRAMPGSRLRPDAVSYSQRIVRELKPDNPGAITDGWRQVNGYKAYLEELTGEPWTAYVDVYKP
ncbi:RHS repeat-associated core domain-containing protein [Frankia sp. Cas4]|uniref:RHS repeat-associated core domain-containing protein n=1 Tax=Frankia sp. Cas4 TaxID=3073927 RepID=UPI002AD47D65|nr:RHS repeat-associated core domain-containing protein [Frankia sp. Cas4]